MISYLIIGQRAHRGIWANCEHGRAQRFVVRKSETYIRNGRKFKTTVEIGVCVNLRDAQELARMNERASKPFGHGYKLGSRMAKI